MPRLPAEFCSAWRAAISFDHGSCFQSLGSTASRFRPPETVCWSDPGGSFDCSGSFVSEATCAPPTQDRQSNPPVCGHCCVVGDNWCSRILVCPEFTEPGSGVGHF